MNSRGLRDELRERELHSQIGESGRRRSDTEEARPPDPDGMPGTILVFRDGHRGAVSNYAIVGQTLWIFSETRARKIPLADLDLDATAKLNDQRGVEFRLPVRPKAR